MPICLICHKYYDITRGIKCECEKGSGYKTPQKVWVTCSACGGRGYTPTHHPGMMPCQACGGARGRWETR